MSKQGTLFNFLNKDSRSTSKELCENRDNSTDCANNSSKSDNNASRECKNLNQNKRRKYDKNYIKLGFVCVETDGIPKPQCVVCGVVLSNECLKPYKLRRHLETKHQQYQHKPDEFFMRKKDELQNQKSFINKTTITNKSLVKASFITALHIAKSKKPFTIAESLLKPCMINICEEMFGTTEANKIKDIPMSNDIICHRTTLIAEDLHDQLIQLIKKSPWFALQIDDSTDISDKSICLGYVRFIDHDKEDIFEEVMFCLELDSYSTSENIFNKINSFFLSNDIQWHNCVGICTDGAAAMTGRHLGVVSRIKKIANPNMMATHCFIHREQLASKEMCPELHEVVLVSAKIINFIKANALNSRLFSALCEEVGADHTSLLLHTEVRWLSRGRMFARLLELKTEVGVFLSDKKSCLANYFDDMNWIAKLSYLADIFSILNQLNLSMQGNQSNIFSMQDKIEAMKMKLNRWIQRTESEIFEMFPNYSQIVTSKCEFNKQHVKMLIQCHLQKLIEKFEKYFPNSEINSRKLWIRDPFNNWDNTMLSPTDEDTLLELTKDSSLKSLFMNKSPVQFWIKVRNEYKHLFTIAIHYLLPFASTYLCEKGFSTMVNIKTKQRNRLGIDSCMRIAMSNAIEVRMDKLVNCVQQQKSH
jgi:zinc finger BED domain-containing protein 5/7/8/9